MQTPQQRVKELTRQHLDTIIAHRRHLHQNPELSFKEHQTMAYVATQLKTMGIPFREGIAGTGLVATIQGKGPGKVVALRADMDALPIQEATSLPFASTTPGVMHACGHDAHTASLLGAAHTLNELKDEWRGTLLLIFQPGEEQFPGGASLMLKEGVLDNPRPDIVIGQHVLPEMAAGHAGFRPGMYMASGDEVYLMVTGQGGHAALPHTLTDTILVASHIIVALQQIVSRMVPANVPTVLSFGKIEGLGATNIIPDKVEIAGTLRTMNEEWRATIKEKIRTMAPGIARAMGADCLVDIKDGYPVVFNHQHLTRQASSLAAEYLGEEHVEEMDLRMPAEDFGFYSQQFPSVFYRFGVKQPKVPTGALHTPGFNMNEEALETGAGLLAWLALSFLK
jgi:amidohydrolase